MDESKLRYFIAVARHLSFSKAAQELHVVQSTVSRQISLLEEELGTPLFYRDTHTVRLTPAGTRLNRNSFSYLTQFDKINENVHNLLHKEEQRLHVVLGPFEQPQVAKSVQMFKTAVPELELHPVISHYYRQDQYIQSGSTRLFFTIAPALKLFPSCQYISLGNLQWKAVTRRDSSFWDLPLEKQAVLQGQQVVKFPDEPISPSLDYLKSLPLENLGFSIAGSFSSTCIQAMTGGVALLPENLETWLSPELRMEQVFPNPLEVEAVLIFRPDGASNLERQFFEFVRDNFKP